jgi:hypothetical protein
MSNQYSKIKQIGVVLPYAVSIRDLVTTGTLKLLTEDHDVSITIYTLNPRLPELDLIQDQGVKIVKLEAYKDNPIEVALKGLYLYSFYDNFAYIEQLIAQRPVRRIVAYLTRIFRQFIGTARFLLLFERLILVTYRSRKHIWQLSNDTDLVLGTRSLLNSIDYGLIAEARTRDIPILTLAGSWDNFTTKGFFPFKCEKILVWNEKMAQELKDIFEVDQSQIAVVGYPRLLMLNRLSQGLDAKKYLKQLGHEKYSRFILYSASYSELTRFPGDRLPLEYQVMAKVSRKLEKVLPVDVCILIRLHPFSNPEGEVIFDDLERSYVFTPGRRDKYVERVMGLEDESHLAHQISLSECVVSLASTITIDALCLGRSVVNTNFDPYSGIPFIYSNTRIFEYNHFKDISRLVKLPMARSPKEVVDFVMNNINKKSPEIVDMQAFKKWYVPEYSDKYPHNVHTAIRDVIKYIHKDKTGES